MTKIETLRQIADSVRSLPNKQRKLVYLNMQNREILNFLAGNIQKDGIGKTIAEEIQKSVISTSTMEDVVEAFKYASGLSARNDKIGAMQWVVLSPTDREFVLTTLYGSLKLGITIPIPNPTFGDTFRPQLCGTGIEFDPMRYIIEEKFDGIRCIGMNVSGKPRLYTMTIPVTSPAKLTAPTLRTPSRLSEVTESAASSVTENIVSKTSNNFFPI